MDTPSAWCLSLTWWLEIREQGRSICPNLSHAPRRMGSWILGPGEGVTKTNSGGCGWST